MNRTSWRGRITRSWWAAQRFGYTPEKLVARITNRDEPRVLCISVPKSGTHLIERVLCLHPRLYRARQRTINEVTQWQLGGPPTVFGALKPGQILMAHLPWHPYWSAQAAEYSVKRLLMIRDPRAIVLSEIDWIMGDPDDGFRPPFAAAPDVDARARLMLAGVPEVGLKPVRERLEMFTRWLETPDVHPVRFEDLVGPSGGGDADRQRATVVAVFEHLGVPLGDRDLATVMRRAFGAQSPTFNQGKIARWRTTFSPAVQAEMDDALAGPMAELGYPPLEPREFP